MTRDPALNVAPYLDSGERIPWTGVPRQGFLLRPMDWFFVPFSLFWAGFAVFWEAAVIAGGVWFFSIWGVPFVAIGLYMVVGRFFVDRRTRSQTSYAVTDQRVIVMRGWSQPQLKSISLRTLTDLSLSERSDRSGTITFGPQPVWAQLPAGWPLPGQFQVPQFEMIPDARSVYGIIRDAQKAPA